MAQIHTGLCIVLRQPCEALLEVSSPKEGPLLEYGTEMTALQPLGAEDSPCFVLSP